jgi:hypothetical protein
MSEWWSIGIASLAILISVISLVWNWRHSESLFRRTKYPAVAWHRPILSKRERNTAVSVTVCNHGPTEIAAVWLGAYLSSKFKTEAWRQTNPITSVPINEELKITITDNLEEDIKERFSGLYFDESWHCEGKPHSYKTVFKFEFQPLIAYTSPVMTKSYYLLRPIVEDGTITSWQIVPISWLRSLLPTF